MAVFKVGDLVMEKDNCFGQGDKIGIIKSVDSFGFLAYQVKYKGDVDLWEYHKGELRGVKE